MADEAGQASLPDGAGPILTGLARASIEAALGRGRPPDTGQPGWLLHPGASFVTVTRGGQLRGCIGSLAAYRALGEDVASNAQAAAFDDPRFPPLRVDELAGLGIEVSVLSPPRPLACASRADAMAMLRPGIDGVVLRAGGRRATFLPQVWAELPDPDGFLRHLLAKAGLPPSSWGDDIRLETYTVAAFHEDGA